MNSEKNQPCFRKIVAIGDSITYGLCASAPENRWVNLLAAMVEKWMGSPVQLCNRGISANILCVDTPAYAYASKPTGLERLRKDVIEEAPDLLLIAYGLNDSRGGTSPAVFHRDYQKMLDMIRAEIDPVIVALDLFCMEASFYKECENWNYSDYDVAEEFNLIIRQLAQKNGLIFADVYSAMYGIDAAVSGDRCHPNDFGHQIIANTVFEAILRGCPEHRR